MNILICDDEQIIIDQLTSMISSINPEHHIESACSSRELAQLCASSETSFDLALMDIVMNDESGITLSAFIQKRFPDIKIIFVSGYPNRVQETFFSVQPYGYIYKPIDRSVVERYLHRINEDETALKNMFEFSFRKKRVLVPIKDIFYFESSRERVFLYTLNEKYLFTGKLDEVVTQIPEHFARCHKSFLVNVKNVCNLATDSLVLLDGRRVSISRSHRKETEEKYYWVKGGGDR